MRYSTAQRQEGREREGEMRKNRMPIHDPTHLLNHWTCECWKKLFCAYQSSNNCSYHVAKEHFFGSWKLFSPFYLHTLRAKNCNQHGKIFSHNFECVPIIIMGRFRGHNDPLIVARWRFFASLVHKVKSPEKKGQDRENAFHRHQKLRFWLCEWVLHDFVRGKSLTNHIIVKFAVLILFLTLLLTFDPNERTRQGYWCEFSSQSIWLVPKVNRFITTSQLWVSKKAKKRRENKTKR